MSHSTKRRWRPRFSLKVFLLACVLVGCTVGMLTQSYRQYSSEQRLLTEIRNRMPRNLMTVTTNGHEVYVASNEFMWPSTDRISVVVDYRGPEVFSNLSQRFNVRIFDRIRKIEFSTRDLETIQLTPDDTGKLRGLETISISKSMEATVTESDVNTLEKISPKCRLASIDQNANRIELNLNPPSPFGCPTQR